MANVALYQLTDVWTGGTAYKGISLNVTDTSSTFGSLLMDLQVGGVSKFTVRKDGTIALGSANSAGAVIYPSVNRAEFYRWDQTDYGGVMARDFYATWANARTTNISSWYVEEGWDNPAIDFTAVKMSLTNTNSGAGSKLLNFLVNGVSQFAISKSGALTGPGVREKLTANRTYYVDITTGNDTTGTGAIGAPWQTLEKAAFWVAENIDLNGKTLEVKLADGTYQGITVNGDQHPWITNGYFWIHGNNTNPQNVIISGDTWEAFGCGGEAVFYLSDLKVQSTVTSTLVSNGLIVAGRPEMGGWGGRLLIGRSANASSAYLIACSGAFDDETASGIEIDTGGVSCGGIASVGVNGTCYLNAGVKINGNHTFTQAIFKSSGGIIELLNGTPFTITGGGVITGKKFAITNGGLIRRTLGTMDFNKLNTDLPGDSNGTYAGVVKEILLQDRTYYVRTDGNNANNGLADSSGGAWATLQYAVDFLVGGIDLNGNTVTLQLNTGTHAGFYVSRAIAGKGQVIIRGSTVNTTDVVISGTTTAGADLSGSSLVTWWIGGVKLESTYSMPLNISNVRVYLGTPDSSTPAVRFGKGANSFWPMISLTGPNAYCNTWSGGTIIDVDSTTYPVGYFIQAIEGAQTSFGSVAFAATTTFTTAFVQADRGAVVSINTADAVSGSAVGKRYDVKAGGTVRRTAGTGGVNNLPGTTAGTWPFPPFSGTFAIGSGQLLTWGGNAYMWSGGASSVVNISEVAIDGTTASTSSTTGALTVGGGAGIAGDVRIGGNHYQDSPYLRTDHAAGFILHNKAGTDYQVLSAKGFWTGSFVPMTANLPAYESDITWNNAAVNFRGVKFNANITACGADSRLLAVYRDQNPKWFVRADGAVISYPPASAVPASNGELTWEATSNTMVTARMKGTDGTVRSAGVQLGGPLTGVVTVSTSAPSGGNDGDVWYQVT